MTDLRRGPPPEWTRVGMLKGCNLHIVYAYRYRYHMLARYI